MVKIIFKFILQNFPDAKKQRCVPRWLFLGPVSPSTAPVPPWTRTLSGRDETLARARATPACRAGTIAYTRQGMRYRRRIMTIIAKPLSHNVAFHRLGDSYLNDKL